ncbi:MAG TPA: hypothetical protein VNA69_11135 [Thermoanaerobaculia bacterium]|nr:hypothetical protein [Thermoanaerobaculia bacterium]
MPLSDADLKRYAETGRYGHYEHLEEPPPHSVRDGLPLHIAFSTRLNQMNLDHPAASVSHVSDGR